ncbi:MAG: HAD family phosphatase [Tissierellia bacterium]|nr:HAD family phosphatase [Tissierellia bacterium]
MIKNIIFDMGGVLIEFAGPIYVRNHYKDDIYLIDELFHSKDWEKVDLGLAKEEDLIEKFTRKYPDKKDEIEDILLNWHKEVIYKNTDIIDKLKNDYKIYALTNMGENHFNYLSDRNFFDRFDGVIASYKLHLIKPDNRIYEKLLEEFDIDPTESIFIDDNKKNIKASEKLGFNSILYDGNIDLYEKIKEIIASNNS